MRKEIFPMMIHVTSGPMDGPELAVRNELNRFHDIHHVTSVRTNGDDSDLPRIARDWARQKGIPTVTSGIPNWIITALDITRSPEIIFTAQQDASTVWERELASEPRTNFVQKLKYAPVSYTHLTLPTKRIV